MHTCVTEAKNFFARKKTKTSFHIGFRMKKMIPISFAARDNKVGCKLRNDNGAFGLDEMDANLSREHN